MCVQTRLPVSGPPQPSARPSIIGDRVAAASSRGHRIAQIDGRLGDHITGPADGTRTGKVFDLHLFVIDKHASSSPAWTEYQHDDVDRFIIVSDLPGQTVSPPDPSGSSGARSPRIIRGW